MSKEKRYDTKSVKEMLLNNARFSCFALGRANSENTIFEEELIIKAMDEVLEKDTGSEEQFKKLLGLSYMLRGITDNLRLFNSGSKQIEFNEKEEPF